MGRHIQPSLPIPLPLHLCPSLSFLSRVLFHYSNLSRCLPCLMLYCLYHVVAPFARSDPPRSRLLLFPFISSWSLPRLSFPFCNVRRPFPPLAAGLAGVLVQQKRLVLAMGVALASLAFGIGRLRPVPSIFSAFVITLQLTWAVRTYAAYRHSKASGSASRDGSTDSSTNKVGAKVLGRKEVVDGSDRRPHWSTSAGKTKGERKGEKRRGVIGKLRG